MFGVIPEQTFIGRHPAYQILLLFVHWPGVYLLHFFIFLHSGVDTGSLSYGGFLLIFLKIYSNQASSPPLN
jgi:hypothetical protein